MTQQLQFLQFEPTSLAYSNNTEYRSALRQFFKMNPVFCPTDDLDPETADELMYDTDTTIKCISAIYDTTKDNERFMNLYKCAAGRIFSEDASMGLTLLFCYDHFASFVPVLVDFWNGICDSNAIAKYEILFNNV